jgi:hypothetical protein
MLSWKKSQNGFPLATNNVEEESEKRLEACRSSARHVSAIGHWSLRTGPRPSSVRVAEAQRARS